MIDFHEPSEVYHSTPCYGSGEVRAYKRSAQLCADMMAGRCDRMTDALIFGIVSHTFFLEPDRFHERVAIKPLGLNLNSAEGKAWKAKAGARLLISHDEFLSLSRMFERMPDNVRAFMAACRKEVTVRTEIDGVPVQCRPDLWDFAGRRKGDLKTIDAIEKIDRAVWAHRYDMQQRFYSRVIAADAQVAIDEAIVDDVLIFAEKAAPFRWRVVELDADYRALADQDVEDALAGIRARRQSGCWDDNGTERRVVRPPERALAGIEQDADGSLNLA